MNNIKELLEILPQIIIYVAVGFIFLKTFHFVALKQNSIDIDHVLTASLVVGFIYCQIAYLIPFSISYEIDHIGIIISSLCFGYLAGRLARSKVWLRILEFFKIYDSFNMYFWDDLMPEDCTMKVYVHMNEKSYEGMVHTYESYSNSPHLVLASFIVKDKNNNILEDFSEDFTKVIILDASHAESIYVEYGKKSRECDDIRRLCEAHKKRKALK